MPEGICTLENCDKKTEIGRKICQMHKSRWHNYKSYDLPERPKLPDGIVKICRTHGMLSLSEVTRHVSGSYYCLACKKEYRKANKELIKTYNAKTRERRQEWVRQDRIKNPDKYKEYDKKYYSINGEHWNDKKIVKQYKITITDYKKMIQDCDNKCQICGNEQSRISRNNKTLKRLHLDHDHKTGKIRGLLCFKCNISLGNMNDNPELLKKAALYLEKHNHVE